MTDTKFPAANRGPQNPRLLNVFVRGGRLFVEQLASLARSRRARQRRLPATAHAETFTQSYPPNFHRIPPACPPHLFSYLLYLPALLPLVGSLYPLQIVLGRITRSVFKHAITQTSTCRGTGMTT